MLIRRLTDEAYQRVSQLEQTMHKKERYYAIVPIKHNGLIFAVPFRSNMNHDHGFKTILKDQQWNGLDYSKAVLVEEKDIQHMAFTLRSQKEYNKVKKNERKIRTQFAKYVERYAEHADKDELTRRRMFGFSTLRNYHSELKPKEPANELTSALMKSISKTPTSINKNAPEVPQEPSGHQKIQMPRRRRNRFRTQSAPR